MPQRGPDHINPQRDDELKHEMQGRLRGQHPTRAEEWHEPEPSADDDPPVAAGPLPPRGSTSEREAADEAFRYELARHLRLSAFPAHRGELLRVLDEEHAPDEMVEILRGGLPDDDHSYVNVQEVVAALGRRPQA